MSNPFRILVLGGYGNFGKRICESLADKPHIQLIIAGRSQIKGQKLADALNKQYSHANIECVALDIFSDELEKTINDKNIELVIHTSGPFQGQDFTIPKTCIKTKTHYIDLADDRRFVCDSNQLDSAAKEKDILLISGASSVPGLSSTVIHHFSDQFKQMNAISMAIAPGNKAERGEATLGAILSYTGQCFLAWRNNTWQIIYGWQDLHRHDFGPPLGTRWLANCDVPDLELFPQYFPDVKTVSFQAGLELKLLHFAMWLMAWCCRLKIVTNWASYTKSILKLSHCFDAFGSGDGGMFIRISGIDNKNKPLEIEWTLVAENNVGPYIPTIPTVILANKFATNNIKQRGAIPCIKLFSLDEFDQIAKTWNIYHRTEVQELETRS